MIFIDIFFSSRFSCVRKIFARAVALTELMAASSFFLMTSFEAGFASYNLRMKKYENRKFRRAAGGCRCGVVGSGKADALAHRATFNGRDITRNQYGTWIHACVGGYPSG
ncbi:hypothetical protein N4G41_14525 [Kosakonia sacchari]|uniref:hypothetical protein n=1 Tax=Kosakonia sacchari TaxID=1158459 RepID=UPI002ACF0815|nr:hypothetical protein [Kosakonia sacchari]MDZ7322848.1 hypothetical protein [Kosakonia sacchari]